MSMSRKWSSPRWRSRSSRRRRLFLDAPYLLDWHNASAVFNDPVKAHIGLVLLTHQLGYFNILPLYVVLLFIAPAVALLHRHAKLLLPLISFGDLRFGSDLLA